MGVEGEKDWDPQLLSRYSQAVAMAITFAQGKALMRPGSDHLLVSSIQVVPNRFQCFLYSVRDDILLSAGWDWSESSVVLLWALLNSHLFQEGTPEVLKSTFAAKAEAAGLTWSEFRYRVSRIRRPLERQFEPGKAKREARAVVYKPY